MSKLGRLSSIIGLFLIGVAAYVVAGDRKAMNRRSSRPAPPVEELSEKLKQAWAGHHNA